MTNLGRLVVMAKNPRPGQVKTRLIPALGAAGACRLYTAMLEDVAHAMALGPWSTTVAVSPPSAVEEIKSLLPPSTSVIAQVGGDLTERMIQVFDDLFRLGSPVVMRNSDSPDLPVATVEAAFQALKNEDTDVVFGPDSGGGYYLVGLKKPCPDLFRIAMSTSDNFQQTLERCNSLGLKVSSLSTHADVDLPEDLDILSKALTKAPGICPQTRRALKSLDLLS